MSAQLKLIQASTAMSSCNNSLPVGDNRALGSSALLQSEEPKLRVEDEVKFEAIDETKQELKEEPVFLAAAIKSSGQDVMPTVADIKNDQLAAESCAGESSSLKEKSTTNQELEDDSDMFSATDDDDVDVEKSTGSKSTDSNSFVQSHNESSDSDVHLPSTSTLDTSESHTVSRLGSSSADASLLKNSSSLSRQQEVKDCEESVGSSLTSSSPLLHRTVDCGHPSSSSDPHPSEQSRFGNCSSSQSVQIDSVSLTFHNTSSAHESCVDSSESSPLHCRTSMDNVHSSNQSGELQQGERNECDSTNREVGLENLHRVENSEIGTSSSCSQAESGEKNNKPTDSAHVELSSSSDVSGHWETAHHIQSGSEVDNDPSRHFSEQMSPKPDISQGMQSVPSSSPQNMADKISGLDSSHCSSSNSVDVISNSVSSCSQSQHVEDVDLHVCQESSLDSTEPKMNQCSSMIQSGGSGQAAHMDQCQNPELVTDSNMCGPQPDDGTSELQARESNSGEVDSTQVIDQCQASSSNKEDGELDSSVSDVERELRCGTSVNRVVSSSDASKQHLDSRVNDSEKEEGEITDDETEEEGLVDNDVPSASMSTTVAQMSADTVMSGSAAAVKYSTTHDCRSSSPSSSSSSSYRFSPFPSSSWERRDCDWGTPYRGGSSSIISSSSNGSNVVGNSHYDQDRSEVQLFPRPSSCNSPGLSSRGQEHSPSHEDFQVDSSSSDRSRHHSDESNGCPDNAVVSTGTDRFDESWRGQSGGVDSSPAGASPISSSSTLPTKRKASCLVPRRVNFPQHVFFSSSDFSHSVAHLLLV